MKCALRGQRFQDIDTPKEKKNMMTALKAVPQQEFQKCFWQWQHRWAKCISAEVEYFKGDPS